VALCAHGGSGGSELFCSAACPATQPDCVLARLLHRFRPLRLRALCRRKKEKEQPMRSIEFHTYLLPSAAGDGSTQPSRRKLTRWQAVAWPGATRVDDSREVRQCPESPEERVELGFHAPAGKTH
jgi:hypothetical protein